MKNTTQLSAGDLKGGWTKDHVAEYGIWCGIKVRCNNKKSTSYHLYGGRGIKIDPVWNKNFLAFLEHVGKRPSEKHSIDRFPDVNGNYEPGNVRWATIEEQANNRRDNVRVTYEGKTQTATQWARELNIDIRVLNARLQKGVPFEEAIIMSPDYKLKIHIPIQELKRLIEAKVGLASIARFYKVDRTTIINRIKRYGIEVKPQRKVNPLNNLKKSNPPH